MEELRGHEQALWSALNVTWPQGSRKHIRCPLGDHEDRNPSWRLHDDRQHWICTCGEGDILDAVIRRGHAHDFKSAMDWCRSIIGNQPKLARKHASNPVQIGNTTNESVANGVDHPAKEITKPLSPPCKPTPAQLAFKPWGKPREIYIYHWSDGSIAEVRARYEDGKGRKEVRPWIYLVSGWTQKQLPGPRPLFRLPELLEEPEWPVLIVEGEGKKLRRALELFGHDHCVTSCSGGAMAATGMDYMPLRGRRIVVWPDNDAPGRRYAETVCRLSMAAGAHEARIVDVPSDWPLAWDLGDECPSDSIDLREMLDDARPWTPEPQVKANGSGGLNGNGLDHHPAANEQAGQAAVPAKRQDDKPTLITPTPFVWRDPKTIPPRKFIYGGHYIRKYVSATLAPGAAGKTSLGIVELLAICTGRPLLGVKPVERCNVWVWNGEDPADELERKIHAAMLHYQIDRSEVEGRFFFDSGREQKIVIAEQTKNGEATICRPVQQHLVQMLRERDISVFAVDPFLRSHRVKENDNAAMDEAATAWAEVANEADISIALYQHTRKTNGEEVTVDDSRGAIALPNAARDVRTVNSMTKAQAEEAGLEVEHRRRYFRVTNGGKSNLTEATEEMDWHRFVSVELGNGDTVGVVERWSPPGVFSDVSADDLPQVQKRIAEGEWRRSEKASNWAGCAVADVMGYDLKSTEARIQIRKMLGTWIKNKALIVTKRKDAKRMDREWIEVGEWV